MRLFAAISLINCFVILFFGEFIYFRDPKNLQNKIFALFCLDLGLWAFIEFMYRNTQSTKIADLWVRLAALVWPFTTPLALLFIFVFIQKIRVIRNPLTYIILFLPSLIISIVDLLTQIIAGNAVKEWWGYSYNLPKSLLIRSLASGWVVTIGFVALILCYRFYRKTRDINKKTQALNITIALSLPLLAAVVSETILPIFNIRIPEIGTTFMMGMVVIIGYTISKYELFVINPATAADRIVYTMTDSLVITNTQGNILITNKATTQMLGFSETELKGKNINVLFENKETAAQYFTKIFTDKTQILDQEINYLTDYHTKVPVLLSCSPIFSRRDILSGAIWVAKDIADRKKAEETKRLAETRKVYVDVFYAVTGEKLVLMTRKELENSLGFKISDRMAFSTYKDLSPARNLIKDMVATRLPSINIDDVLLASDEALTNAVKHAGKGYYQIFRSDNTAQVLIADNGQGIDFKSLPKATLLSGYSTKQTLGVGFNLMLQLSSRVLLATHANGTSIVLEFKEKIEEEQPFVQSKQAVS